MREERGKRGMFVCAAGGSTAWGRRREGEEGGVLVVGILHGGGRG